MTLTSSSHRLTVPTRVACCALALALGLVSSTSFAQPAAPDAAKPPAKTQAKEATNPARKPASKAVAKRVEYIIAPANAEQIDAAKHVFYGIYDCEFKQSVRITEDPTYPSYVGVAHGKATYLMKPVMSSTGAVRLEDVRGETLMVQISSKSMLLNVRTGQRVVDDCITPRQRELVEAARAAKAEAALNAAAAAAAAAAAIAAPASAPTPTPGQAETPALAASAAAPVSPPAAPGLTTPPATPAR